MSDGLPDVCSNCGTELQDEMPGEPSEPCPKCGSTSRTHRLQTQSGHMRLIGGEVELQVRRAWDSNSLTLAGVIYGIVVTVLGVVVATLGTLPTVIYAVVVLGLLAAGLLLWAQPIIGVMRWASRPRQAVTSAASLAVARGLRAA
jgi:hypothetical protein